MKSIAYWMCYVFSSALRFAFLLLLTPIVLTIMVWHVTMECFDRESRPRPPASPRGRSDDDTESFNTTEDNTNE